MEKTIRRMKEYAEAIQNTYPTDIIMEVDESIKKLKLDMKIRHGIFLIFKTALHTIALKQTILKAELTSIIPAKGYL